MNRVVVFLMFLVLSSCSVRDYSPMLEEGISLIDSADYVGAREVLQRYVEETNDSEGYFHLARSFGKDKDYVEAFNYADTTLQLNQDSGKYFRLYAIASLKMGFNDKACVACNKAIALSGDSLCQEFIKDFCKEKKFLDW